MLQSSIYIESPAGLRQQFGIPYSLICRPFYVPSCEEKKGERTERYRHGGQHRGCYAHRLRLKSTDKNLGSALEERHKDREIAESILLI